MKPSREIRDVVLGWYHDLLTGDPSEIVTGSEHGSYIGTGPGEVYYGGPMFRTALRVQEEAIGRLRVYPGDIRAYEEGTVGWATDVPTFELESGARAFARMTFVFHREGGQWRMVHGHASHEASNEAWGDLDLSMDAIAQIVERDRPDLEPMASPEGTVTIMFTDVEDSTATNERLGDDTFLPLLLRHHDIVKSETASAGGSIVKSQGDGFMLAFPSARKGVECAMAVQRQVGELDGPIRVRMGLHTGEPVRHADDFYGRDVAYAARIGAAAIGGEILISGLVKSLVEPSGAFIFDGPRDLELKGFDGMQSIWAVRWEP